jgi:hypothetical protein
VLTASDRGSLKLSDLAGFYGGARQAYVRPSHAKRHLNCFVLRTARSRSRIQVAEPANGSLRLVKKTAFSTQSREALARQDYPLPRGPRPTHQNINKQVAA